MTELLVSVRSPAEAEEALAGGAALIDVKEPKRGALGRADFAIQRQVVQAVSGRVPVSAALGELWQRMQLPELWHARPFLPSGVGIVKWGLAGFLGPFFASTLAPTLDLLQACHPECRPVVVAYADAELAHAPPVDEVCAFARARPGCWFLLDTFSKTPVPGQSQRATLLDWLPLSKIALYCKLCQQNGVRVALGGSLGFEEIRKLQSVRPDWFAVRGAACEEGERQNGVSARRVKQLVDLIQSTG